MTTTTTTTTINAAIEVRSIRNLAQAIVRTQVLVGDGAQLPLPLAILNALTDLLAQSEAETYTGRKDRNRIVTIINELRFEMQQQVAKFYGVTI